MTAAGLSRFEFVTAFAALLLAPAAGANAAPGERRDLAALSEGVYFGRVASDVRGTSHDDVTVTVTRTGPNQVRLTSNYRRLSPVTVALERPSTAIMNDGGDTTFLLDLAQSPPKLELIWDEAAWSGTRTA